MPEELGPELARFVPHFQHWLIDLSRIQMERIGGELILRLAVSLLKAAREAC